MRYFYITYEHANGFGWFPCTNRNESFPRLTELQKNAYSQISGAHAPDSYKDIMITNIIELNEQDYNDFVK
jgi:hypothetical protein